MGVTDKTAWQQGMAGHLDASQLPTGTIAAHESPTAAGGVALFTRACCCACVTSPQRGALGLSGGGRRDDRRQLASGPGEERLKLKQVPTNPSDGCHRRRASRSAHTLRLRLYRHPLGASGTAPRSRRAGGWGGSGRRDEWAALGGGSRQASRGVGGTGDAQSGPAGRVPSACPSLAASSVSWAAAAAAAVAALPPPPGAARRRRSCSARRTLTAAV
jgi:hypothetical protein